MTDIILESMIEAALQSADANKHLIGAAPTDMRIAELIRRNDFVTVLWRYDEDGSGRLGILPVKGLEPKSEGFLKCVTIPCADEAAAVKIVEMYGDEAASSQRVY